MMQVVLHASVSGAEVECAQCRNGAANVGDLVCSLMIRECIRL
jgi:hypothetical protein